MDGIDSAVAEVMDVGQDSAAVEQPVEQAEKPETQPEAEVKVETDGDGRVLPKDVQAALKALRETNPVAAKALRESFFANNQFRELYKTPSEARAAKVALDTAGGVEGIANLQAQVAAIELVDQSFEQGNPQVIDDIVADFPDGFKKIMPYALDKLQQLDNKSFTSILTPHLYAMLEDAGLGDVLSQAFDAIGQQPDQAKRLLQSAYRWLEGKKQEAGQRKLGPDPEREQLTKERESLEKERDNNFRRDVGRETTNYQKTTIEKSLNPYLKTRKLSDDAKGDLLDGVNREVTRILQSDASYQTQMKALFATKNRDRNQIVSYVNSKLDEAVPRAADIVWKRRYGFTAPAKPVSQAEQPTNGTKPQGGPILLNAKPSMQDIEKNSGYMEAWIAKKAIMRTGPHKGHLVTWK